MVARVLMSEASTSSETVVDVGGGMIGGDGGSVVGAGDGEGDRCGGGGAF